jgi:hypothetical protein
MQPTLRRMGPPKYAEMPNHPIKIHPVRPLYRFMATGLGASMWFFVRWKFALGGRALTEAVDVPREEGRPGPARLEAPLGPLNGESKRGSRRKTWTGMEVRRPIPAALYICKWKITDVEDDAQYPSKRMQSKIPKLPHSQFAVPTQSTRNFDVAKAGNPQGSQEDLSMMMITAMLTTWCRVDSGLRSDLWIIRCCQPRAAPLPR